MVTQIKHRSAHSGERILGGTLKKLHRFLALCERNPEIVLEHIKTLLAHGAKPRELADRWNSEVCPFLVEARVDRETAIATAADRVIYKIMARDGCITWDTARFVQNLSERANNSKLSLRRVLADVEKRALAMLAEPSAWPREQEKCAYEELRVLEAKNAKSTEKVPTYPNTQNSTFTWRKPAENRDLIFGLDEKTLILATRGPSPAGNANEDRFNG